MPWVSSIFTSSEIAAQRMSICNKCPELTKLKLCRDCGCIVPAKIRLIHASCPRDKWGNIEDTGEQHFVEDATWEEQEAEAKKAKSQFEM